MRRALTFAFIFVGISLIPPSVFSDTVMLYTEMQLRNDAPDQNVDRYVAIEDGVMSLFFDSGHIIFDTGIPQKTNLPDTKSPRSEVWAVHLAEQGGARYLLALQLTFPDVPYPAVVPSSIHYKLKLLASGSTLTEGDVKPTLSKSDVEGKKPYDLCFALGQEVARDAMRAWLPTS